MELLVRKIHSTSFMFVYEFAGCGAQVLNLLHSQPQSSKSIIEATDRYSKQSLISLLGSEPDKCVSEVTAKQMAECAWLRACKLMNADISNELLLGISCTGAIKSSGRRAKNQCFIGVHTFNSKQVIHLEVDETLTRVQQEYYISEAVIKTIASICAIK